MKSNICKLSKDKTCLKNIIAETEKVLEYNNLNKQNALRLRLLAEEMVGLISELIENYEGDFWLENDDNKYRLYASLNVKNINKELKDYLIDLSSNKKNNLAKGIKGKILSVFQNMALDIVENGTYIPSSYYYTSCEEYAHSYSYAWSLTEYTTNIKTDEDKTSEWDELEKSIIAKLATDVLVGVLKDKVEILIVKDFN